MERPKLYLDLNLYCRAFNDQTQLRLYCEARAVDVILNRASRHVYEIYWSYVLDMENSLNHNLIERRIVIGQSTFCRHSILPASDIQLSVSRISTLSSIKRYDAEHIACAEFAGCDYFLTGDDRLLRQFNRLKAQRIFLLRIVLQNPVDFLNLRRKRVMKDKAVEEIEELARAEGENPLEEVMRRGIDALEKELDPIELSRFISELRRMKSGVPEIRDQLPLDKSMKRIRSN